MDDGSPSPYKEIVVGYNPSDNYWMANDGYYWHHCAETPTEEKEDVMKLSIDNENELLELREENQELKTKVNELKNSSSYQTYCGMCNTIAKLVEKLPILKRKTKK